VWADFAGTIGKVVDESGTGINGAALKEAIRRGQIVTVHRGTDGTHPTLVVEKVENPADAGSSLTLDALKDVTAPASTAAGMFLGTTGVGAWGPVANPTSGVWPGKTRTSRPNSTDRLVEVWDGAAWIPTHYDSGMRDVTPGTPPAGWSSLTARMQRIGGTVQCTFQGTTTSAGLGEIIQIPAGFRWPTAAVGASVIGAIGSAQSGQSVATALAYGSGGSAAVSVYRPTATGTMFGSLTWVPSPLIPTSLPGTTLSTAP
jgi:hypothetical protein